MKLSAAVLLLLALASCNNEAKPAAPAANATDETQSLLIYSGRDKGEVDSVVAAFQEKFPKYKGKVQTVILGAQAALERLRAEKSNPQAGFLWGGTQQGLQQIASEGLLSQWNPSNAGLFDANRKDPQGRWWAEMLLPEVIVYNRYCGDLAERA